MIDGRFNDSAAILFTPPPLFLFPSFFTPLPSLLLLHSSFFIHPPFLLHLSSFTPPPSLLLLHLFPLSLLLFPNSSFTPSSFIFYTFFIHALFLLQFIFFYWSSWTHPYFLSFICLLSHNLSIHQSINQSINLLFSNLCSFVFSSNHFFIIIPSLNHAILRL